jgi:hypothetical protein
VEKSVSAIKSQHTSGKKDSAKIVTRKRTVKTGFFLAALAV